LISMLIMYRDSCT